MNREQRRSKPKKVDKHSDKKIKAFESMWKAAMNSLSKHTDRQDFKDGDRVMMNVDAIKARPNYGKMNQRYRDFVENNAETVFTVEIEHENGSLIRFKEEPTWLFWGGDLLSIKDSGGNAVDKDGEARIEDDQ